MRRMSDLVHEQFLPTAPELDHSKYKVKDKELGKCRKHFELAHI
jgi:hypothetical protein